MKKVLSSLFAVVLMLFCGIWLTACGNQKFDVGFKQTEITLEMGQIYDPFDFIATPLTDKQKDKVQFKSENPQIVYLDSNKMLVPITAGQTTIYVQVQKQTIASCVVNVPAPPIVLNAPTGLNYNQSKGQLEWNYSYYELDGDIHTNAKYVLEIAKDGGEYQQFQVENANVFAITEPHAYAYTARIQAKAATDAFASSAFSDAINFNLMGKPTNLAFNPQTKTLSWQDDSNPQGTKYNISYTLNGGIAQTINDVEGKSYVFANADVGVHSFQVITVAPTDEYFINQSDVLRVEQLGVLNPTFNNGVLTWNQIESATGYHVQIFLDGTLFEEEIVQTTISTLPKTACSIASKNYEVCVQALGDDENIFDGKVSKKIGFEKLPLAQVVYHQTQNAFEVANATFAASWIKLSSQNEVIDGANSLVFTAQSELPYQITARLVAANPAEQIDGEIATTFTAGDVATYQTIQNLSNIAISYAEEDENGFVQYIEREPGCTYTIYQNGQKLEIAPANHAFMLGSVVELFATLSQHTFSVYVEKAPTQTAFFVPSNESLAVQKLSAPKTLTLDGINVKVVDSLPEGASQVGYTINGETTSILNTTQTSWGITARFVAQSTPIVVQNGESTIPMFFSSGASTYFQIKRLEKVDGLKFDYTNKTLIFNTVLEANTYVGNCGAAQVFETTQTSVVLENVVGKVVVQARPAAWAPITTGTVGYIESLPSDITIYQIDKPENLWLSLEENDAVTAHWTAPDETYGKDVAYSVFVKYNDGEYILEQNNITTTSFTFANGCFDNVGDYAIKVQVESPNDDFLTTNNTESVKLSRLAAPQTLSRSGNTLTIKNFNAGNMFGVVVTKDIDGTQTTATQSSDKITIDLQDAQTLTLSIKFLGKFDAKDEKYNLGSLPSTYTIYKLGAVKNLKFDGMLDYVFDFSWTPNEQNENGVVPDFVDYKYKTSYNSTPQPLYKKKSAAITNKTGKEFTFFVREVATNDEWFSIDPGNTRYLSSDTYKEVQVYQEQQVTNLKATIDDQNVTISWHHKHVEAYTPGVDAYNPTFSIAYINKNTSSPKIFSVPKPVYVDGEGQFEQTFKISDFFADAGQYSLSVSVASTTKTLPAESLTINFTRLSAITNLSLNDNIGTFVNADGSALDTKGVEKLVVSGAVSQINGATIDLSSVTAGEEKTVTVYRKAQIGEVGILNYYLDSAPATFTLVRLENQDVEKDLANNKLYWQNVAIADVTLLYMLEIESAGGWPFTLIWNESSISLDNSILASLDLAAGIHKISVRTMVSAMNITTAQTGYLPSDFGGVCEVEKLATVKNLALSADENNVVSIAFDEVMGANLNEAYNIQYNIFIADTATSVKTKKLTTSSTTVTCGDWFTGTKYLFVQTVAEGTIPATISAGVCVVQLESILTPATTEKGILSWGVDVQVQTLPIGGYVVEVLDASNQKQFDTLIAKTNKTFDLLAYENDFIKLLDGGKFVVSVMVKGAANANATLLTLSSAKTNLEITKLFQPTIQVKNNFVEILCPSQTQTNVQYFVTISNGTDLIFNDYYSAPIDLGTDNAKFEITAYATTKTAVNNIINSNTAASSLPFERLSAPTNLMLSTTTDASQESVSISWDASASASGYEIYVNDALAFTADADQTSFTFDKALMQNAGTYQIKMRAIAEAIPYSVFTDNVTAIRLAAIEGAYVQSTGVLHIPSIAQSSNAYTIALAYTDMDNQADDAILDLTTLSYDGFADEMIALSSGTFFVDIRFVGDGVMKNSVITLSSANVQVVGFKLESPTIQIAPNKMQIQNATTLLPNNLRADTVSKTLFGAHFAGATATLDDGTPIANFEDQSLTYPKSWVAGEYTITAHATPLDDVVNILPSNQISKTITRLDAPTNLKFVRSEIGNEVYTSDNNAIASEDFISSIISFKFDAVANANGYLLNNGAEDYASSITATKVDVLNTFEQFVYGGKNEINVVAVAKVGTDFINSAPSTITFRVLSPVESITTNGTTFEWQTSESDIVAFLIAAIENQADKQRFWQSTSATQRTSNLNNLQFEGDMALNIKIVGNVTTAGTSSDVVLDSQYMQYNQQFIKLAQIKDLATDKGHLTFTKINGAEQYVAKVFENGALKLETVLEDYAEKLNLSAQAGMFIGYSNQIAELSANVDYDIQVYATSTQENVLFANPSDAITAKVLENKNAQTPLALITNQYGQLDKKTVRVALDENAKGVWVVENGVYTAFVLEKSATQWAFSPTILRGGTKVMSFAGFGTTQSGANGHYLSSAFSPITLTALDKTQIAIKDGTITWQSVTGADAYYVYINGNLFDGKAYYSTTLALDTSFGGPENKDIKIEIVPVVVANDKLWGPKATYEVTQFIKDTENTNANQNIAQKLHMPNNLHVENGALLWTNGIAGLDTFTQSALDNLLNALRNDITEANINALESYIQTLFTKPITIYSPFVGFEELLVDITFTQGAFEKTIQFDAFDFLTISPSQKQNLEALITTLNADVGEIYDSMDLTAGGLYDFEETQTFATFNHYLAARLALILQHFNDQNPNIQKLLSADETPRYPTQQTFFEELEDDLSAGFAPGTYSITITQLGNNADWLDSSISAAQDIYLPAAATNLQIIEKDFNYYLLWDAVTLDGALSYSASHNAGQSSKVVYGLYGETKTGARTLITTTVGDLFSPDGKRLSMDLTNLIETGALDTTITKLFLVVMGNISGNTDQTTILNGLKSAPVAITVLPQVKPSLVNGILQVLPNLDGANASVIIDAFEITAQNLETEIISGTTMWHGAALTPSVQYALAVRFVGEDIDENAQEMYILSGKKFDFNLTKLAPMDVKVNQYGIFEWIAPDNAQGFALDINSSGNLIYVKNPQTTSYENQTIGFNNFKFQTLGQTLAINPGGAYFMTSAVNNANYGIDAVMMTATPNVFVEDGLIKWQPLDTTLAENNTTGVGIVGYKLVFTNGKTLFTTNLSSPELSKDENGNLCLDFTNFGEAGNHTMKIQAFAQVNGQGGTTLYNGKPFDQLLGATATLDFNKITAPRNIQIVNGEIVWTGNQNDQAFVYELSSTQGIVSGMTTQTTLWPETIAPEIPHTLKLKAYQDGSVFSSFTNFISPNNQNANVVFEKLAFANPSITKTTQPDGNYIQFTIGQSAIELAVNLKYKINDAEEYSLLKYGDVGYDDIITINSGIVKINATALHNDIQTMEYMLQLVPVGNTTYLASNFTSKDYYVTPQALDAVHFDESTNEFFFKAENHVGYIVKDELLDNAGNLVATYYYQFSTTNLANEAFFKQRMIGDVLENTISFAPVAQGFVHQVSVAVCEVNAGVENSLMSPFVTSEYKFNANMFGVQTNIFEAQSPLFTLGTRAEVASFLTQNAFGSSGNAFTISNAKEFANLNLRLQKYSYLNTYTIQVTGVDIDNIAITENQTTFTFAQTTDIDGITKALGHREVGALGSIKYQGFAGVYDGQNFALSYTLEPSEENDYVALFRVLENGAQIKNLKIAGTIAYNGAPVMAGLVGQNNGTISNVEITELLVSNLELTNLNFITLSFGGVTAQNNGTIQNVQNNAENLDIVVRVSGVSIYVGGIAAQNQTSGKILQSGNNMMLNITSMHEARVGGIAGQNNGQITECFNRAQITALAQSDSRIYVGGIVGYNDAQGALSAILANGNIVAQSASTNVYAGGIIGFSKNANTEYGFSTVAAIITQTDVEGSATKYGGTLFGWIDTTTPTAKYNFFVNAPAFGKEGDDALFDTQQIDASTTTALSNLVSYMNSNIGNNVFVVKNANIVFAWENA